LPFIIAKRGAEQFRAAAIPLLLRIGISGRTSRKSAATKPGLARSDLGISGPAARPNV
jgi:hypothetical protein